MCPITFFYQVLIAAVVLLVIYSYRRMYERACLAIQTFSSLLEGPCVNTSYLVKTLTGYYKGRKVKFSYLMYDNNYNYLNPSIEPRYPVKKQSFFCISFPRPTQNTLVRGDRIYYSGLRNPFRNADWLWNTIGQFSQEECVGILEELTRAAVIVEHSAGASYVSTGS